MKDPRGVRSRGGAETYRRRGGKMLFQRRPALSWQRKDRTQVPALAVQGHSVAFGSPN